MAIDIELATILFNAGNAHGHHTTVEGGYTDVLYVDRATYHREEVEELIRDYQAHQHVKA